MSIRNGTFSWLQDKPPTLKNINLCVKNRSLTAIVGSVGAGKSSILSAVIGDMHKISGTVTTKVRSDAAVLDYVEMRIIVGE